MKYSKIKSIDNQIGTPFYIMHPDRYEENVKAFLSTFQRRYDKVIAGYSFKTNYVPQLCMRAKQLGCYAEVVSKMEYELAVKLGFEKIIFNGPIKTDDCLTDAINRGAIINLDSEYEIDSICEYKAKHPEKDVKVGIRINVKLINEDGQSAIQSGLRMGRFGFPYDILKKNISQLRFQGVKIVSLHGHTSSSDRAVNNYKFISEQMLRVCEEYKLDQLEYFDVGGGFWGAPPEGVDTTNKPTYQAYADSILDVLLNSKWFCERRPRIVIEPGCSVVTNVFDYVTKVYQNKQIVDVHFVTVDGSVFDVKPTLHANNLIFEPIRKESSDDMIVADVVGSTCMEKDVILKNVSMPAVEKGDYLLMKGVGAYTICLTPTFINYLSPIVSLNGECLNIARRRQTLDDVLSIYQ